MVPLVIIFFLTSSALFVSGADIIIPDGNCFDQYTSDLTKLSQNLIKESRKEYNLQLTSIEEVLDIATIDRGYMFPLSVPTCTLIDPPSNHTLTIYNVLNRLNVERMRHEFVNRRVMYRLMMIQKRILQIIPRRRNGY